jgi:hypothetical protein
MKLKLILTIVLLSCYTSNYAQKNLKDLYEVSFFKWVKNGEQDEKVFFKVDSLGNVIIDNNLTGQKLNIKSFNNAIHKFVNLEKLEKTAGNNEPPRVALIPERDKQSIHINIVFLKDYYNEKEMFNKTTHSWYKTGLGKEEDVLLLYKYLGKADKEVVKSILR